MPVGGPRDDEPTLGLPYAPAGVDPDGAYYVLCPLDDLPFRGVGSTEDEITKSASEAYAQHYMITHMN